MQSADETKILAAVGQRIRNTRDKAGLTLKQLARLSGFSAPALSLIETGKRDLRVSSLHRIADALRVPVSELLQIPTPTKNPPKPDDGYDLGDYS